jgi:hypothetical protein
MTAQNEGVTPMKVNSNAIRGLMMAGVVALATVASGMAQDTTRTQVRTGTPTSTTTVEKGELIYVSGNDLVLKMDTGEFRHMNVPDTARAIVDGKELSVHDLKPGMKLQRTITTTSTPKTVTTIRTIQGTVWSVIAPSTLILSFPEGPNKTYNVPKDQKFVIDGKTYTAFELRKGMKIAATVVSEATDVAVAESRRATGTAPAAAAPPPPPPPPTPVVYVGVLLIELPAPATPPPPPPTRLAPTPNARAAAAGAEPAPKALPKTASSWPMVGLLGILFCTASLGIRMLRRYSK